MNVFRLYNTSILIQIKGGWMYQNTRYNLYIHALCSVGIATRLPECRMPRCHICSCYVAHRVNSTAATSHTEPGTVYGTWRQCDTEPYSESVGGPGTWLKNWPEPNSEPDSESRSESDSESERESESEIYAVHHTLQQNRYRVLNASTLVDDVETDQTAQTDKTAQTDETTQTDENETSPSTTSAPKQRVHKKIMPQKSAKKPKSDGKKRLQKNMTDDRDRKLAENPFNTRVKLHAAYTKLLMLKEIPKYTTPGELFGFFMKSIEFDHDKMFRRLLAFANFKYLDIHRMGRLRGGRSFSLISLLISYNNMKGLKLILTIFKETSEKDFDFKRACVGGEITMANGEEVHSEKAETPLAFAARNRNSEAFKILLKEGADVHELSQEHLEYIFKFGPNVVDGQVPPYQKLIIPTGSYMRDQMSLKSSTKKWKKKQENKIREMLEYQLHST